MLMIFEPLVQIRYAEAGDFSMTQEGYLHCKTLPVYIFAQAYEGWYELEAGGEAVRCEEGGAFFTPPNLPLKIRHHVNRASGVMRVRYVHFLTENALGLDLFSGRKPLLALSAAECAAAPQDINGAMTRALFALGGPMLIRQPAVAGRFYPECRPILFCSARLQNYAVFCGYLPECLRQPVFISLC